MTNKQLLEKATPLLELSYNDWKKLSLAVTAAFRRKEEKQKETLFATLEDIAKAAEVLYGKGEKDFMLFVNYNDSTHKD